MKLSKKNLRVIVMILLTVSFVGASSSSTTSQAPTELAALSVKAENVRVRTEPCVEAPSQTVGRLDMGDIIIVEKTPFKGEEMSWYRIIGMVDKVTGVVTDVLEAIPQASSRPYVSANFVEPYSGAHNTNDLLDRILTMPYGIGYGVIDRSPEVQRKMAEQKAVKWCFSPNEDILVYSQPSTASEVKGYFKNDHDWSPYDLVTVESRPGWLFVVDMAIHGPSGWVQADKLKIAESDDQPDRRETAFLFILNLGANIQEIINRWGAVKIPERTVELYSVDFDGEPHPFVSAKTLINGDGFELEYENHGNLSVTLTRKGAGLGGIFVGETWCNKAYIENTFGHLGIHKVTTNEGNEHWSMDGGPDGWQFNITVYFDLQGSVSQLRFSCSDVMLN